MTSFQGDESYCMGGHKALGGLSTSVAVNLLVEVRVTSQDEVSLLNWDLPSSIAKILNVVVRISLDILKFFLIYSFKYQYGASIS